MIYSRFWHKFLYDIGVVPTPEPYAKRTSHGMILGENGEKIPCVYYTITDSTIVYRMEKTDCDKIMAYLEYTPDTTASDTEASPDTESAAE